MTEKIQMTEEQAREIYQIGTNDTIGCDIFIYNLKLYGYIRKSELQQKVEEAEDSFHDQDVEWQESSIKLFEVIQLLKQSHPEFKGE